MKSLWLYIDTSTYIKLYVKKDGSENARELAKDGNILSSAILSVECISALSRRKSAEDLVDDDFRKLVGYIKKDINYVKIIRLTDEIIEMAEDVALQSTARAMDAIHIASAKFFKRTVNIDITFVTSDKKQLNVASHQGLKTLFIE